MSTINKEYLDLQGLQLYDTALKNYIPAPDGETIIVNEDNELEVVNTGITVTYSNGVLTFS